MTSYNPELILFYSRLFPTFVMTLARRVMENKKKGWSGKRDGAGRPSTGKSNGKAYTFTLSEEAADIIEKQKNLSEFVRRCILQSNL